MIPEIGLLTVTKIDWPTFRATMDKALDLRPDIDLNSLPIELSEDAKYLLNLAVYYGWSIKNPLDMLRNLPSMVMKNLSYSFFIACDKETWEELNLDNTISIIKREVVGGYLLVTSGTLEAWYYAIVNNLERDREYSHKTRTLFCKLMIAFERRGLNFLFEKYVKKVQQDYTWLLEHKK